MISTNNHYQTRENILAEMVETSGLDFMTCEQIFELFIQQSYKILASISICLDQSNYNEAKLLIHKLKGSSGNVRATSIRSLAENSEQAIQSDDYTTLKIFISQIKDQLDLL